MVKRVALFQAADGQTFSTEKEAVEHEAKVAVTQNVWKVLMACGLSDAEIFVGEEKMFTLEQFLINNAAQLIPALSGTAVKEKKPRQPRKARQPAAPVAPVEPTAAPVVTEDAAPAPVTAVAEPVAAAGDDDMLNELLAEAGN